MSSSEETEATVRKSSKLDKTKDVALAASLLLIGGLVLHSSHDATWREHGLPGQEPQNTCPDNADARTAEKAAACEQLRQHGKIAIIGYDIHQQQLKDLADKSQKEANRIFGSNIVITPVQINAVTTQKVKEHLIATSEGQCINPEGTKTAVSLVAQAAMHNEIEQYDAVIGVSELPTCESNVGGAFMQTDLGQAIEVTGARDITATKTIVHELGHMFGLGHSDELYSRDTNFAASTIPFVGSLNERKYVDLSSVTSKAKFESYGEGCTIMGSTEFCDIEHSEESAIEPFTLNPVQRALLDWPGQVLHNQPSQFVSLEAGTQPIVLSKDTNNIIAELDLEVPAAYDGYNGGSDGTFNKLGLTYNCNLDREYEYSRCVDLYFYNDSGTAYAGSVGARPWEKSKKYTLNMHGQSVVVSFKKNKVIIQAV